jgi:hypothetical protein
MPLDASQINPHDIASATVNDARRWYFFITLPPLARVVGWVG